MNVHAGRITTVVALSLGVIVSTAGVLVASSEAPEPPPSTAAWAKKKPKPRLPAIVGPIEETGALLDPQVYSRRWIALPDGRVVGHGGFVTADGQFVDEGPTADNTPPAEIWDPATGQFSDAGTPPIRRISQGEVVLADGRVLIFGGSADVAGQVPVPVLVWDPASLAYEELATFDVPLLGPGLVALADGRAIVAGGVLRAADGSQEYDSRTYLVDPVTGTVTDGPDLLIPRLVSVCGARLPDGRVVLGGGIDGSSEGSIFEIYDPATDTLEFAATQEGEWAGCRASTLPSGEILLRGGSSQADPPTLFEVWDPGEGTSQVVADPDPAPRSLPSWARSFASTTLADGRILQVRGAVDEKTRAIVRVIDVASGTVADAGSIAALSLPAVTALPDGRALIVGWDEVSKSARAFVWSPTDAEPES